MLTWTITRVQAKNYYDVVNSNGTTIPSGSTETIWDNSSSWTDGPTGSIRPIIFRNAMAAVTAFFNINISGSAPFTQAWRDGYYEVVGYLNRRTVFQSQFIPVPSSGDAVQANGMYMWEPNFSSRRVAIPFRYGGDFLWYIYLFDKNYRYGTIRLAARSERIFD
jgi:hypothetical protein